MQLWSSGTGMPAQPSCLEQYTDTGSPASQGGGGGGVMIRWELPFYCKELLFIVRNCYLL